MRRSRVLIFIGVATAFAAAACSLDDGAVVVDDAPVDGSSPDAGRLLDAAGFPDGTVIRDGSIILPDGAVVDSGSGTLDSSVPKPYACGATQVANCATDCPLAPHDCPSTNSCVAACFPLCTNETFQCDGCDNAGAIALSRCEPGDAAAFTECMTSLNRCQCADNDAAACPGNNQTCENNQCFECGEVDASATQSGEECQKPGPNTCHITSGTFGSCHS